MKYQAAFSEDEQQLFHSNSWIGILSKLSDYWNARYGEQTFTVEQTCENVWRVRWEKLTLFSARIKRLS